METSDDRVPTTLRLDPKTHEFLRVDAASLRIPMNTYIQLMLSREMTNNRHMSMTDIVQIHKAVNREANQ